MNYVGQKFIKWTVVKDLGSRIIGEYFDNQVNRVREQRKRFMLVKCTCGIQKEVRLCDLKSGRSTACRKCASTLHDGAYSNEYRIWLGMKQRCYNIKTKKFNLYGGRGIKVCSRWLNSFENFLADMGKRPSEKHSIDRINSNGNYEPSNCRWATIDIQNNNTSRNKKKRLNGFSQKPLA